MQLTNEELGELLAVASESCEGQRQKALRRAARLAFAWPVHAADALEAGTLTELAGVGPWVAKVIEGMFADPLDEQPDPPPIRDGFMSFAYARSVMAEQPELRRALKGDLQMHSNYSDGRVPIVEMARRAQELGHSYIAITDHSKGLKIAGGMDEGELGAQWDEIDRLNGWLADDGFRVLKGLEMNVSPDGSGDMEPEAFEGLDLVLGSFHSKLRVKEDQTDRYLAALENPDVNVLGHPRGRIFNFRMGLRADWETVFKRAAELDKAVEIDCYPDRQDIDVHLGQIAREAGVRVSIGTDAHNPDEMYFIEIGVATALDAGIEAERIINLMEPDELVAWARSTRG